MKTRKPITVENVRRELRHLNEWENEARGFGNRHYAPTTREQWNKLMRRRLQLEAIQRNIPRRPARSARVIQRKFKKIYYAPVNNGVGIHGRGYRKVIKRLRGASPQNITRVLRSKLSNLQKQSNNGVKRNIYNSMHKKWIEAGGVNGANIMNNAQKIMFKAGLIL
jgi:hypothetical protein